MEIIAALIGAVAVVAAALITILPALRRTRSAVEADGSATRTELGTLIFAVKDELRSDVAELREHITDVRAWQAGHDAEHYLQGRPQQRGDS